MLLILSSKILSSVRNTTDNILEYAFQENGQEVIELEIILVLLAVIIVGIVLQQVATCRCLILEYFPMDKLFNNYRQGQLLLYSYVGKTFLFLLIQLFLLHLFPPHLNNLHLIVDIVNFLILIFFTFIHFMVLASFDQVLLMPLIELLFPLLLVSLFNLLQILCHFFIHGSLFLQLLLNIHGLQLCLHHHSTSSRVRSRSERLSRLLKLFIIRLIV